MKHKSTLSIKVCVIIYFCLLLSFLGYLVLFTDVKDFMNAGKKAEERDYSSGWKLESGEEVDLDEINAGKFGGHLHVSKILPDEIKETDSIYFSTSNMRFGLYVNGVPIYSFDTRENMTGTGDGISYHMIGLGSKDAGAEIVFDGETVFSDIHGGRINEMQFGSEEQYRYYMMRRNLTSVGLSLLMILFGIALIVFYIGMAHRNSMLRSLWALGLASILFGLWSLCDTGIPQLLTGMTYATRDMVYGILHLAGFPIICFVYYVTRSKRKPILYLSFLVSIMSFGGLLCSRYVLGRDLHTMVGFIYFSYAAELLLLAVMLIDNELFCRKKKISSNLRFFYIGAGIFIAASVGDMIRYILIGKKGSVGHGSLFRFGLVFFFILMAFQIFDWWTSEKTSLERDRFINRLLQYGMDADDPDVRINKVLKYLCLELHAERAYIFEDMHNGTFDNTYEFCDEGVTSQIDNLKGLPYEGVIDVWYHEYEKGGHILIYDIEKYRSISESMYNVLKPQGILTLVTGPLVLEGEYIGLFGVDNPPAEMMEEVSEIIRLLTYFLSEMVSQRNHHKRLVEYSYHDPLTGAGNRRAVSDFENEKLDTSRPYGFIMCDINGLKDVNDSEGHEAGDRLIKTVVSCLTKIFGEENVYRMGGDEFAVYAYEDTREGFEKKIEKARAMVKEKGIEVAIGYSFAEGGNPDYGALRVQADNRMYEEKRKFYNRDQ
ncbi:MAG: diguanylate cyclase [Lachnospiraceae bacterium]|nr:diguanylate cyclase [Lachnospiraceae bacterium]